MKKPLLIFAIPLALSSCATVMNQAHQGITVYTTAPSRIVYGPNTYYTTDGKVELIMVRGGEAKPITAIADSTEKTIILNPGNSFMYYANIPCNFGLGMLVDRNTLKKYTYPKRVYINSADTLSQYFRHDLTDRRGELYLHLSVPHINSFLMQPQGEGIRANTGFWGLAIGLDYYHGKNRFANFTAAGVADFFLPFPAVIDLKGEHEAMRSSYISISNNHHIRRFSVGYGLSLARNTWRFDNFDAFGSPPTRAPAKKSHRALGLVFPVYYGAGEYFNAGLIYRPTFLRLADANPLRYEHLISIDFAWKIRLNKSGRGYLD